MAVELFGKIFLVGLAVHFFKKLLDRLFATTFRVHAEGIIVVTGASTGIGRHAAESLASRGYVVLAGVRQAADAKSITDLHIDTLVPVYLDVTDEQACIAVMKKVAEMTAKTALPFVALVNNAGVMRTCPIEFHAMDDMRRVFDTNVFGSIHLTQCAIPLLKESKGRIVNITSFAGIAAPPLQGAYAASKHALEGYSDSLRRELGSQFGISVSIVEPAYVLSNLQASATATSQGSSASSSVSSAAASSSAQRVGCIDPCRGVAEEEVKAMYSQQYNSSNSDAIVHNVSVANTPDVTTWAITDAIVNARPRTRYPVANAMGIPTWFLAYVFSVAPDRLVDMMMKPIHL